MARAAAQGPPERGPDPGERGAWALGLLWTVAPSPLIDESAPPGVLVGVCTAAGLLMALAVALLTGLFARSLARRRPS